MKIGLIDVDSKLPNLVLMKLSAYHKKQGDSVEFYKPVFRNFYDKIYASKIFDFTENKYIPSNTIRGGSGYNLTEKLPYEIEHIYPNYELYNINYGMGYLTRGCNNNCGYCIVREKEGHLHKHADLGEFWNGQKKLKLLDNSLTDYENAEKELTAIRDLKIHLDLTQGFNIRTIKPKIAKLMAEIKPWKSNNHHIAWDNIKDEKLFFKGIELLAKYGVKKLIVYVLTNYNSTFKEDLYRLQKLRNCKIMKLLPFVMIYNQKTASRETKRLRRWCTKKSQFLTVTWEEYKKERGIRI